MVRVFGAGVSASRRKGWMAVRKEGWCPAWWANHVASAIRGTFIPLVDREKGLILLLGPLGFNPFLLVHAYECP